MKLKAASLLVLSLALAGCSDDTTWAGTDTDTSVGRDGAPGVDVDGPDAGSDAAADTGTDTVADVADDTPADVPADAPVDTPADTPADAPGDIPRDVPGDTGDDASDDTPADVADDTAADVDPGCEPVTDVDGNTYSGVAIGSQCWMGSNLNTTRDADGVAISRWCCDCDRYGGMYDWSAVMNGSSTDGAQGICPDGWHVPSDADWFLLESYIDPSMTNPNYIGWNGTTIGDQLYLGGPLGFDWITGGFSYGGDGCSYDFDRIGYWTSSNSSSTHAVSRFFNTAFSGNMRDLKEKRFGFHIRCLKD